MDAEANSHHLWVITISIIASLLLHLMMKYFAKGITFWILNLHNRAGEQKLIGQIFSCCQVFVPLKSVPGDVLVGLWSFFQECLKASAGTECEPQGITQNQNPPSAGTPISSVLKCEGDVMSGVLTGVWVLGETEKEWAKLITGKTSGFWGPHRDSQNVYELDLSVVN